MPLVANNYMFPFAAMDKNKEQEKMQQQAKDNLYMQSLQREYAQIKDTRKDAIFVKGQMDEYNTQLKTYQDHYGDYAGALMYRNSDDYKLTKLKYQQYEKLFDEGFDLAHQVDVARRTQHMPDEKDVNTETQTETKKGESDKDVETSTTSTNKKAGVYVSPKASAAVDRVLYYAMKDPESGSNLENTEQLAQNIKDMKLATGADEAFADPIKALANSKIADIKQLVIDGKWQNTIATNPYYIQETTGKDFDNFAYEKNKDGSIAKEEDGSNKFSSSFNSYYNKAYGGLDETPDEKQQHKKEIYDQEKEAIAKQITDKEDNIVTGTNEAVKNQIAAKKLSDEEQKTTPTIKPASTTLIIGGNTMQVAKNYDIGSSSTKNKNMVSLNTIGSNVKDNTPSNLSGNYYVDNVFISDDGSAKAIVSDTPYNALDESGNALHQDQQGNWLNAKNEETEPTKFIKDPNANESVVNYNDVSSTINTNFNLQDFPAINTSVKQQTAQPNNTTPQSKQGSFFNK
jgi:hypothetical protein